MRKAKYVFNEAVWSEPGFGIDYDATPEIEDEVILLKEFYPEISAWSDLALFTSWGSYSQDHHNMTWSPVFAREELFLGYLYEVEQQKEHWDWSDDVADRAMSQVFD